MPDDYPYLVLFNKKYVFPVQFAVGCIGNILNLVVLNSRGMRTKTNCFLSAMAVADLGFFLSMFPVTLQAGYDLSSLSQTHKLFFLHSHIWLLAFANWFSAASIWLTIGVTVERLIAIKFPLLARTYWKKCRIIMFIVFVYVMALLISLYHFAWRTVERSVLNETAAGIPQIPCIDNISSSNSSNNENGSVPASSIGGERITYRWEQVKHEKSPTVYYYVHISHGFFAISVILLPLACLIVLSSCLVYYLRLNTHAVQGLRAGSALLRKGERRVTWTVVVLILAFTFFNFPSGIFAIIEIFLHQWSLDRKRRLGWFYDLAEMANALVCTNKAINFGLYCSASSGFRRKLVSLITRHRFCGRVVRTLSTRFSISSGGGNDYYYNNTPGNQTVTCKYSMMTTVFHETRGNEPPHRGGTPVGPQQSLDQPGGAWSNTSTSGGGTNGHAFLQRRAQSIDVHSRSRTASNTVLVTQQQLQQFHLQQHHHLVHHRQPSPARARTCSAL